MSKTCNTCKKWLDDSKFQTGRRVCMTCRNIADGKVESTVKVKKIKVTEPFDYHKDYQKRMEALNKSSNEIWEAVQARKGEPVNHDQQYLNTVHSTYPGIKPYLLSANIYSSLTANDIEKLHLLNFQSRNK